MKKVKKFCIQIWYTPEAMLWLKRIGGLLLAGLLAFLAGGGVVHAQTPAQFKFPSQFVQVNATTTFLQGVTFNGPPQDFLIVGFYNSSATLEKATNIRCADIASQVGTIYAPEHRFTFHSS